MQYLDERTQKEYKAGQNYLRSMGFIEKWNKFTDFKEMRMWPEATERTKGLPRISIPFLPFLIKHKAAVVNSKPLKLTFKPVEVLEENDIAIKAAEEFTKFAETEWRRLRQDKLNGEMLDKAATLGTGLIHYFYDANKAGGYKTKFIGQLCGEKISVMNLLVGNPQEQDLEKQPHFEIPYRDSVLNIKETAKANGVPANIYDAITPEKETSDTFEAARHENELQEDATVICRYWKEKGIVYFKKVCQGIQIVPPTKYWGELPADVEELYPVVDMKWEEREGCYYGIGEGEGIIDNNKAINFIKSMQVKNVQDTAWSKWVIQNDALKGQQITNEPGQVLHDRSGVPGNNIRPAETPSMNGQASQIANEVADMTRTFTGVNEAATGEPFTRDLNAQALEGMRAAAAIPINEIQKRYYYAAEKIGRLYELFFKTKYSMPRTVKVTNELGDEESLTFKGDQYKEIPLELIIDVGPSSNEKDSLSTQRLDLWLEKQYLDFDTALDLYSNSEVPFKQTLKLKRQKQKEDLEKQQAAGVEATEETPTHKVLKSLPEEEQQRILQMPENEQVAYVKQLMDQQGGINNAMQ